MIYPALGAALGHRYPAVPTFGAPCPSTIFTFGILLWTAPPVPKRLLVIPFLWAVLTAPMAIGWGVVQDIAMPIIAVLAVVLPLIRNRDSSTRPIGAVGSVSTSTSRPLPSPPSP